MTLAEQKQLRHVFAVSTGATPKAGNAEYWDGNILWVTPKDLSSLEGYWLRQTRRMITHAGYESCSATVAEANSVVLTKRAPIGKVALLANEACSSQGCFLLVPRCKTDTRFYYYWLSAHGDLLQALGQGSSFVELRTEDLKSLNIPHPTLLMQSTIADYLDRETARLDALVAAKERVLALLAEKRQAFITRIVTRGLDPHATFRDSGIPWLGEIPLHWHIERARWLFRKRDQRSDTGDEEVLTVSNRAGVIRPSEKDVTKFEAQSTQGYKVCLSGNLVVNTLQASMGAMGVSPIDGIVSSAHNVFEPNERIHSSYIDALVRLPTFYQELTRYSRGVLSSQPRLDSEGFFTASCPVPPLAEQHQIVAHIASETGRFDRLRTAAETTVALLKERRDALISEAVNGGIDLGGMT